MIYSADRRLLEPRGGRLEGFGPLVRDQAIRICEMSAGNLHATRAETEAFMLRAFGVRRLAITLARIARACLPTWEDAGAALLAGWRPAAGWRVPICILRREDSEP